MPSSGVGGVEDQVTEPQQPAGFIDQAEDDLVREVDRVDVAFDRQVGGGRAEAQPPVVA